MSTFLFNSFFSLIGEQEEAFTPPERELKDITENELLSSNEYENHKVAFAIRSIIIIISIPFTVVPNHNICALLTNVFITECLQFWRACLVSIKLKNIEAFKNLVHHCILVHQKKNFPNVKAERACSDNDEDGDHMMN